MSTLHRLESKLESLPSAISGDMLSVHERMTPTFMSQPVYATTSKQTPLPNNPAQGLTPTREPDVLNDPPGTAQPAGRVSISFSQHGVILWPGAREVLPDKILRSHERLGKTYVIDLEMKRPPLTMHICPFPLQSGDGWLEVLPLAMIKGLSHAFFSTFNPITPIMDQKFYFTFTLGAAIESGFGYTIETCLALNVMALGCLAVQTHYEGNYPLSGSRSNQFEPPEWMGVVQEEPSGLRFFNEARRRIGFLMCGNDIQSCQFYLLSSYAPYWTHLQSLSNPSSVYYSQIVRPLDWWAMIHRAATCCLSMLTKYVLGPPYRYLSSTNHPATTSTSTSGKAT